MSSPTRRSPAESPRRVSVAPDPALTSDARPDIADRVFSALRELIVWGQLPPGARMSERKVGERLGAGRTAVRKALHRLQQEGFVTTASRGGSGEQRLIVAPMTREDGEELYLMVGHLEGLAARTAAKLPLPERKALVARMAVVNRRLESALRGQHDRGRAFGRVRRIFDLDLQFHRLFVDGVVGPRMLALHHSIKPQTERYARAYIGVLLGPLSKSVVEHEEIMNAILKGDLRSAQTAVETNWHNAVDRLVTVIGQYGERGSWGVVDLSAGR